MSGRNSKSVRGCAGRRSSGPATFLAASALALAIFSAGPVEAVQRRAFVTSIRGKGKLADWPGASGATALEQADAVCRTLAAAADPPLPNPGTYRAWLSTATTDAYCHVQGLSGKKDLRCGLDPNQPLPGGGPWFLANGLTPVTGMLDALVAAESRIFRGFAFDENLESVSQVEVEREFWTGTTAAGAVHQETCQDWTSDANGVGGNVGDAHAATVRWTTKLNGNCAVPRRLLCLEPGTGTGGGLFWGPGALVFATSELGSADLSTWDHAGGFSGVNAGYEICQSLAAEAALPAPGSFAPWLSTQIVPAAQRVTTDGPFRRIDGQRVAVDFDDLVDGSLTAGIHQDERGTYLGATGTLYAWTGTLGNGTQAVSHCNSWSQDVGGFGVTGGVGYGGVPEWSAIGEYTCSSSLRLYCISNVVTIFWDSFELTGDTSRWSNTVGGAP